MGNAGSGVLIDNVPDNVIGTSLATGNVLSGNKGAGLTISGSGAKGNLVQGNYIGTDVTGSKAVGNGTGVAIIDAPDNTIGGQPPAQSISSRATWVMASPSAARSSSRRRATRSRATSSASTPAARNSGQFRRRRAVRRRVHDDRRDGPRARNIISGNLGAVSISSPMPTSAWSRATTSAPT